MKISSIRVFQVDLPLVEGRYSWSEGKYVEVFDSTVVELVTDDGLSGYGEVCPLGPFYLPAFGAGARAGIAEPCIDTPTACQVVFECTFDQPAFTPRNAASTCHPAAADNVLVSTMVTFASGTCDAPAWAALTVPLSPEEM